MTDNEKKLADYLAEVAELRARGYSEAEIAALLSDDNWCG